MSKKMRVLSVVEEESHKNSFDGLLSIAKILDDEQKIQKYLMMNIDNNLETDKPDENTAKNANNE